MIDRKADHGWAARQALRSRVTEELVARSIVRLTRFVDGGGRDSADHQISELMCDLVDYLTSNLGGDLRSSDLNRRVLFDVLREHNVSLLRFRNALDELSVDG